MVSLSYQFQGLSPNFSQNLPADHPLLVPVRFQKNISNVSNLLLENINIPQKKLKQAVPQEHDFL